jgi:hypothetical protein
MNPVESDGTQPDLKTFDDHICLIKLRDLFQWFFFWSIWEMVQLEGDILCILGDIHVNVITLLSFIHYRVHVGSWYPHCTKLNSIHRVKCYSILRHYDEPESWKFVILTKSSILRVQKESIIHVKERKIFQMARKGNKVFLSLSLEDSKLNLHNSGEEKNQFHNNMNVSFCEFRWRRAAERSIVKHRHRWIVRICRRNKSLSDR